MQLFPFFIKEQKLVLSAERCLFWEDQQTLILSDMHIGKAAHFRKSGIAVPQQIFQEDLHRLFQQIHFFSPKRIIVTGDLFHSESNLEHEWFSKWRAALEGIQLVLVKGNHEILHNGLYEKLGIEIVERELIAAPFRFAHDLNDDSGEQFFLFSEICSIPVTTPKRCRMSSPLIVVLVPWVRFSTFTDVTEEFAPEPEKFIR
jgi:DNA ligase-associated metallophosphoesterase